MICIGICCSMLISNTCIAQNKSFSPGYYIDQRGDTIKGFISMNDKDTTSVIFKFKTQLQDANAIIIPFDSSKSVFFKDELYVIWHGKKWMEYVDKFNFDIINPGKSITATIPLKLLYKGSRLSLYYYFDVKDHFFIDDGNSMDELLVKYRYISDWEKTQDLNRINLPTYFSSPLYQYQIIAKMGDQLKRKQKFLIEATEYETRAMLTLFKALDRSKNK